MSLTSYLPPPSIPSVSIQPYIQGFARVAYRTAPTGNTAVYFPGLSGSVLNFGTFFPSIADPSTSNIYVEMWIYPTDSNGSLPFTVSDSGSEDMGLLFNFGTQLEFRVWNTTGTQINSINPGTVTINQWYHIAGSFDFTNNKVYSFVNGFVGSSVGTFTGTARSRATSSLILGAGNAGTFIPFGGYTRDFRFIKGGIVPTTSFTPSSAPFGASLPPYVSGNGTNVMSITSQYLSQQGSITSYLPPPSIPSVSIQSYIQGFVQVAYRKAPTGNTAVYFRGLPSSYLNFGSTSPANFDLGVSNLFAESWVYIIANQATATSIIGRHNTIASPAEDWMIWISSTGLPRMRVTSAAAVSQDATLATVMNLGQWYHLAGSFDTTNKKIYVFLNGTASAATTFTGTPRYNSTWAIQAGIYTGGQYQNGYTQDIRVVQGGIVPTTSFTPNSAPFGDSLPSYVTGNGTNVMSITSQYLSQQGKISSTI
jgi:hypothetical protein